MSLKLDELCGRWHIVSWIVRGADGRIERPFGGAPRGFVFYAPDGTVACLIASGERKLFPSASMWSGSIEEKASAYDTFLAYGGRFKIVGDTIEHTVVAGLCPNWEGIVLVRSAKIEGDRLTITAHMLQGAVGVLVFERQ